MNDLLQTEPPSDLGKTRRLALGTLIAAQLITGGTYLVAKLALREISPIPLGCLRFLLTGTIFTLLLAWKRQLILPDRRDWRSFVWCGLLAVPLNQGLFLWGMKYTAAGHGALLYATTPMMVMILSTLLLRDRPTRGKIAGVLLGFCGVALVLLEKGLHFSRTTLAGDFLVFLAVVTWAMFSIASKNLLEKYSPLYLTGMTLTCGALLFLPLGLPSLLAEPFASVSRVGWLSLIYLSVMTSVIAYLIWAWALSYLDVTRVAIVSNLQPVVAAALGWVILGEPVTHLFFVGAVLVFVGVLLTQRG